MEKVHSHYENLKVARNAPPEVIHAAYRTLSQKYHPDRNPGNNEAARIMAILNVAFEVLRNPEKRREHDKWIADAERGGSAQATSHISTSAPRGRTFTVDETKLRQASTSKEKPWNKYATRFAETLLNSRFSFVQKGALALLHVLRNWILYGIGAFALVVWVTEKPKPPPAGPKPYVGSPAAAPERVHPAYVRSATADNGQPWPTSTGYVRGYPKLNNDGLSTITIDNTGNDSDVFVKLVSLDGPQAYPVRSFFIAGHGSLTLDQVTAGRYDIRYRELSTGRLTRSEAFDLVEDQTNDGIQFSRMTLTLYKMRNGNMQTFTLAENEF